MKPETKVLMVIFYQQILPLFQTHILKWFTKSIVIFFKPLFLFTAINITIAPRYQFVTKIWKTLFLWISWTKIKWQHRICLYFCALNILKVDIKVIECFPRFQILLCYDKTCLEFLCNVMYVYYDDSANKTMKWKLLMWSATVICSYVNCMFSVTTSF